MPYNNQRVKRNSMVDMLTKVPVHRGSLLKSIENLLKTIESSESAVMIPTLLRDKCEFDAWELLFVAKILKASILGHIDLVEFYMNHIGLNAGQFTQSQTQNGTTPTSSEPPKPATPTTEQLSPSAVRLSSNSNGTTGQENLPISTSTTSAPTSISTSNSTFTSTSTSSSLSLSMASVANPVAASTSNGTSNGHSKSSTIASWASVVSQQTPSSSPSAPSSLSSVTTSDTSVVLVGPDTTPAADPLPATGGEPLLAAATRVQVPLNQRPSLLQLTTTNNHINSVAAVAANLANQSPTLDHLTSQLLNLQQQQQQQQASPKDLGAHLSIATGVNQQSPSNGAGTANGHLGSPSTPNRQPPELRSSRSAGCLFRMNSGASSPRTPTTPGVYPQAETLAKGLPGGNFPGDPSAPVKLLLQIEQLKASIGHVTSLLESVVELYKKSIDTLA